MIKAVGLSATL
jgi:hypothetical protein